MLLRIVTPVLALALLLATVGTALAVSTGTTGQPNQSCEEQPASPGKAGLSSNTGSPFSANGKAGTVYAGTGPSLQHANSPHAVSQYDVACFQVSQPHP